MWNCNYGKRYIFLLVILLAELVGGVFVLTASVFFVFIQGLEETVSLDGYVFVDRVFALFVGVFHGGEELVFVFEFGVEVEVALSFVAHLLLGDLI